MLEGKGWYMGPTSAVMVYSSFSLLPLLLSTPPVQVPFMLEGKGGLFEFIEQRLRENDHCVLVTAEGAGQNLMEHHQRLGTDESGNTKLLDVGLWLSERIKVRGEGYALAECGVEGSGRTHAAGIIPLS